MDLQQVHGPLTLLKMPKSNFFTRHLRDIKESYFAHMSYSLGFARDSFISACAFFTHSIFPFILLSLGSSTIRKLQNRIIFRTQLIDLSVKNEKHVAIVGFGLSGLVAFSDLVKNYQPSFGKLVIRIFEKSHLVKGTAYSTKQFSHLLNVTADRMGVVNSDQEDFFKWLCRRGYNYKKTDFVPRHIFGIYLENILQDVLRIADEKNITYEFHTKEISEILLKENYFSINAYLHQHCILAMGTQLKDPKKSFWNNDLAKYLHKDELHILGCGLTAIDAVVALRDLQFAGKIILHSRGGKLSQPHKIFESPTNVIAPLNPEDSDLPLSKIFRKFINACASVPDWRIVFDAFYPATQKFWMVLETEKKKRFMRHCFRLWNIHRHRCPESQFQVIEEMMKSGQLQIKKGRSNIEDALDCTGFEYGFASDLIQNLVKNELVKFDELRAGIIPQHENIYVAGGLNFGSLFEITAAPNIAPHALKISERIMKTFQKNFSGCDESAASLG